MSLRKDRCDFTRCLAYLVLYAYEIGYECNFDEGMDRKTVKDPTSDHKAHSNHDVGLAQDINLFKNGVWLTKTEDHALLGAKWKTLHPLARWGGDFGDGNHYSFEYQGRK